MRIRKHSALIEALLINDSEKIKRLLKVACNLNDADSTGWTPLIAASAKSPLNVVSIIVDSGCDVNKGDPDGFTPLIAASGTGRTDVVRFLVQHGALVDLADISGTTPLSWSVTKGDFDETAKAPHRIRCRRKQTRQLRVYCTDVFRTDGPPAVLQTSN